ncbi:MAG: YbbR-like domain-containing protein [Blautia hansenii]
MKKNMINKFTLKVLSLIIAILIWLLVRNVDDPIVVRTFYEIPVSIENASYLAENLEIPLLVDGKDTVKVRVKGARSVVSKLKKEDIKAVADMTQIISKDTTPIMVPVEVTGTGISDSDITVRPRNIQVDIEKQKSVEKTIAVSTGDTQPDKDYEIGNLKANPEKVTISGPETIINKIDKVVALIDVTGRKESNIEIKSQLKIYDKNLDELSPKQLEYLNIKEISDNTIRIQAQFWKVKQNVKIKAEYSGEPKRGYEVDSINLVPDTISVAGTDEALKKLEQEGNTLEIPGKYIDVTDKTGDFEQNIDLSELLPEDLKLVRDLNSSVIATVKILPYNSRDYEVSVTQIEADNKAEDLDLVFQDEQITIRAKAKEQDLDSLSAANIQVQIDLNGYGEGEYEVPVTVTLPGGYELVESIKVKVKLVPGAEK